MTTLEPPAPAAGAGPAAGPAGVTALELAADAAWPAPVRGRVGQWLLRAAGGWTGRANSALPIGDPGLALPQAIDAVQRWYLARDLSPAVNTPLPLAEPVRAELAARGWSTRPPVLVQTAPLARVLAGSTRAAGPVGPAAAPGRRPGDHAGRPLPPRPPVRLADAPSERWLRIVAGRKGGLPAAARHVLTSVPDVCFAEVPGPDGEPAAIARGTVTDAPAGAGRWFGIFLVETVPAARRQGLALRLVAALAEWAAERRAQTAFLQVEQHNTAARALYAGLGFTTHHTYLTHTPPGFT